MRELQTRSEVSAIPALVAIVGLGLFAFAVMALHFLRPDYNPATRFVSEYALGNHGWFMKLAFFALAFGSTALVVALRRSTARPAASTAGFVCLGLWALCVFVAGIVDTDLLGAPDTVQGAIHGLASLVAFVSLILSSFLLLKLKQDERWAASHRFWAVMSFVMLGTFLAFVGSMIALPNIAGLVQRIFLAVVLTWLFARAKHAHSIARS